jgi:signal transduction histidine kinase
MRLRGPDLSDRRQLNLAWAGAVALVALGLVLGALRERDYRQQITQQAAVQAEILSASVSGALAFDDRDALREYVDALRADRRIARAAVYDANGKAVVTYTRPEEAPPPAVARAAQVSYRGGVVEAASPVSQQGARLGSVFLATRPEPVSALLTRHSGLGLLTVMAILLLGVITRAAAALQGRTRELIETNERLTFEMGERARAEEALRQSQKMEALGQLTGGIAHDFNNLLQVMHGAFELIRRKSADQAKVAAWAENGLKATDRAASLTRQLLAFSRAQKLELRTFVVSDLIGEMRELLQRTLGADIELVFDLKQEKVPILSDRTQLELAVLNLAINARDAMPDGGRLTVSTRVVEIPPGDPVLAPDTYVELAVSDTGAGMSAEVAERAFDPFFTTKGVGKGTGLGLSQVYGVARQAGGAARLETAPGRGTSVSVLLRRSQEAVRAAPKARKRSGGAAVPGSATVLVVDDEADVRRLVQDSLEVLGYRVVTAADGPAALAELERATPDLMLLDFAMPGMNGAEAATLARQRHPDLPIVFASGYADTAQVETALGGQAVILRKPFDMEDLADTVAAALKPEPAA